MNIRQLQYVREIAKQQLNISAAAKALHTSQPGVSKQVKLLEAEIGAQIFLRSRNKVTGLTEFGESILPVILRIVSDVTHIREAGKSIDKQSAGTLTVATTHTYAHYVLPQIMKRFLRRHPKVRLVQRLANADEIPDLIASGEVDVGVKTADDEPPRSIVSLSCRKMERVIIVPRGHELTRGRVTLQRLAQYPFIARNTQGGIFHIFKEANFSPNVALAVSDIDVIKACVAQNFGVSVLLEVAYDPERDTGLHIIPAGHIFGPATMNVLLQRRKLFRHYLYDFIEILEPKWNRDRVENAISGVLDAPAPHKDGKGASSQLNATK